MLITIIELLIVLLALYLGSKYGSLALGAIAGIGLALLVFDHGLKPGTPPTDVIYIIVAAVTCAARLFAMTMPLAPTLSALRTMAPRLPASVMDYSRAAA